MSPKRPMRRGTIRWACDQLGYSHPIVRGLIRSGKLRTYGTGHSTRISDQAIADCIALLEQETAVARGQRSQPTDNAMAIAS
jgi:excisionase family DNA binding protein